MKLNTLIVNGELHVIENYKRLMEEYCAFFHLVGIAGNLREAKEQAVKFKPDIVFWDIDISAQYTPEIFKTKELAQAQNVFVMHYEETLLKNIQGSSLEYILKPLHPAEMIAVESKMMKQLNSGSGHILQYYKKLQGVFQSSFRKKDVDAFITVYMKGEYKMVQYNDILAFEASGAYTKIHLYKKEAFVSSKNIGYYQGLVEEQLFRRVHKSFIVNTSKIASIDKAMRTIRMINNQLFPVSVRLMSGFMSQIVK